MSHDSGQPINTAALSKLGVLYYYFPDIADLDKLATDREYKNRDEIIISPEKMGSIYKEKVAIFFEEHLHEDEEIRYIRAGRGFFDVRSKDDQWVRIRVEKGDLLILPAGIYHRFTTDEANFIHAMRLFKDEPKWTPLNRSDIMEKNIFRRSYKGQYLNL